MRTKFDIYVFILLIIVKGAILTQNKTLMKHKYHLEEQQNEIQNISHCQNDSIIQHNRMTVHFPDLVQVLQ